MITQDIRLGRLRNRMKALVASGVSYSRRAVGWAAGRPLYAKLLSGALVVAVVFSLGYVNYRQQLYSVSDTSLRLLSKSSVDLS